MKTFNSNLKRQTKDFAYLGILMVFVSILIDEFYGDYFAVNIIDRLLSSTGVAIIVAALFSWITSTEKFMKQVRKLLQDIVVEKNFLSRLKKEDGIDVMTKVLNPNAKENSQNYDFCKVLSDKSLCMANGNIRANYSINSTIMIDSEKGILVCHKKVFYDLYPAHGNYEPLKIAFSNLQNSDKSGVQSVTIMDEKGDSEIYSSKDIADGKTVIAGTTMKTATIDMKKYNNKNAQLSITIDIIEYGEDHWFNDAIQMLLPTKGVTYNLTCQEGLKIKSHEEFTQNTLFSFQKHSNGITFSTNQWLLSGAGICVLVAK